MSLLGIFRSNSVNMAHGKGEKKESTDNFHRLHLSRYTSSGEKGNDCLATNSVVFLNIIKDKIARVATK